MAAPMTASLISTTSGLNPPLSSSRIAPTSTRASPPCGQQRCPSLLPSCFLHAWEDWRSFPAHFFLAAAVNTSGSLQIQNKRSKLIAVNEIGGQYEDSFADVDKNLLDYFTFKAVKTVLAQLLEMNPGQYTRLYSFVVNNQVQDGKHFCRVLVKESQELGERVMITRLHLFNKWVKKYDHANMHKYISGQNVEILRERLIQTVKFVPEDESTES